MPNLFFFCHYYPFKTDSETFIENELSIAAEYFDYIYILPLYRDKERRSIPKNAKVITPPFKNRIDIIKKGLVGLKPRIIFKLIKEFLHGNCWKKLGTTRDFIIHSLIFSALMNSPQLKEIKKLIYKEDILYSYWGTGWCEIIPFQNDLLNKFITRFHRGDLYSERGGPLLFRTPLLSRIDKAIFISRHGEEYEHKNYSEVPFISSVSYLGTEDHGISTKSTDNKIRIVSCSHITPVKRVDYIFKVLCDFANPQVIWTHIGGEEKSLVYLKKLINSTPHNFQVCLLGSKSNKEVLKWFSTNPVDIFINLSSSEGIPVSIMEAISFNIPIVATKVGGMAEIINEETGVLISRNPSNDEIISAIESVLNNKFSPRKYWQEHFMAITNYHKFFNSIIEK